MAMTRTVTFDFAFHAHHWIPGLPGWHQCGRGDAHRYVVTFELADHSGGLAWKAEAARATADGPEEEQHEMPLEDMGEWFAELDGATLNDRIGSEVAPTAEHVASWMFRVWVGRYPELQAVTVRPDGELTVEYRREPLTDDSGYSVGHADTTTRLGSTSG